jgi:hypothetical protein
MVSLKRAEVAPFPPATPMPCLELLGGRCLVHDGDRARFAIAQTATVV